jgi:hypothetical protein
LTDASVDSDQLAAQLLPLAILSDLVLCIAPGRGGGERFGDGLALAPEGQPEVGAVGWLTGQMTAAVGIAAASAGGGDGARTEITQLADLIEQCRAPVFEGIEGFTHEQSPGPSVSYTLGLLSQKKKIPIPPHLCRAPGRG